MDKCGPLRRMLDFREEGFGYKLALSWNARSTSDTNTGYAAKHVTEWYPDQRGSNI